MKQFFLPILIMSTIISAQPLSIEDTIKLSHKRREDLEAFTYEKKASFSDQLTALAEYLPHAEFGVNVSKTAPEILLNPKTNVEQICPETTRSIGTSFKVSQLLISGGGPVIDYKIAKQQTKIVSEEEQNTRNSIQFDTETSFLNAQKLLLKDCFVKTKNRASEILFEKKSFQKKFGLLNNTEWFEAATSYASEQSDVANYAHDLDDALAQLQRQTNSNIQLEEINASTSNTLAFHLEPVDYYVKAAQLYRPDLKAQKHLIRQAKLAAKKYSLQYVPEVRLVAQAADLKFKNESRRSRWAIGLDLSWNLDGLAGVHATKAAQDREIEYRLQKRDLEIRIKEEVKQLYFALKNLINLLKVTKFNQEEKRTSLEKIKKESTVGLSSQADLAQAYQDYEQSKFDFTALKIDVKQTYQNLLFVCGYPKKNVTILGL